MDKTTFLQLVKEKNQVIFFTPSEEAQIEFYNLIKKIELVHFRDHSKISYHDISKAMAVSKRGVLTHASLITLPYLGTKYRIIDFLTGEQINKNY